METIVIYVRPVKNAQRIFLEFDYNERLVARIRDIEGAIWETCYFMWHIPFRDDFMSYTRSIFGEKFEYKFKYWEENSVIIEIQQSSFDGLFYFQSPYELREEIRSLDGANWHKGARKWSVFANESNRKQLINLFKGIGVDYLFTEVDYKNTINYPKEEYENLVDPRFIMELKLRNRSQKTIDVYCSFVNIFLNHFKQNNPVDLTDEEIRTFIFERIKKHNYSHSYQNQMINGIKRYYEYLYSRTFDQISLPRPHNTQLLPKVLSRNDVKRLISHTRNQKHRLIIMMLYGCGFRLNELLELKLSHIDFDTNTIFINKGKGGKQRIVPVGETLKREIRRYIDSFIPKVYLFECVECEKYSATSVQTIVRGKARQLKIKMRVTPHVLRHSYATHLLEEGIDLRVIQVLLGHKSTKTTEIYTYVIRKNLINIKNPVDRLGI